MKSTISKVFKVLLGVIAFFALSIIVINLPLFDEELDPEANRFLHNKSMTPAGQNAYVYLLGFEVENDKDMLKSGHEIIKHYENAINSNTANSMDSNWQDEITKPSPVDRQWKSEFISCNARKGDDCSESLSKNFALIDKYPARFKVLINRYEALTNQPNYTEIQQVTMNVPWASFGTFVNVEYVLFSRYFAKNEFVNLYEHSKRVNRFWRMVLEQSDSLIAKMVATSRLWTLTRNIHTWAKDTQFNPQQQQAFRAILQPLSDSQKDLGEAFYYEAKYSVAALEEVGLISSLVMQENATLNLLNTDFVRPLVCLAKLDEPQFTQFYKNKDSQSDNLPCNMRKKFLLSENKWWNLYNIGGRTASMLTASFSASDYIARMHDLDKLMTAVYQNETSIDFECLSPGAVCRFE